MTGGAGMIDTHELKRRDLYLDKLKAFQDTEPVKVITGIRRCGKSSLLKLMVEHLKQSGITPEQIVEMNFESHDFMKICAIPICKPRRLCMMRLRQKPPKWTARFISSSTRSRK